MAFKMLDGATTIGASKSIRVGRGIRDWDIEAVLTPLASGGITAITIDLQGSLTNDDAYTGVITNPTLVIGTTNTRVTTTTFYYRIADTNYTKAAVAAGVAFSAAHVIGNGADDLWGCINIYINASGTVTSKVPLATQVYASATLAMTAADAIITTSDLCYIGRLLINMNAGTFTGNTTALTGTTSTTYINNTSTFHSFDSYAFTAGDLAAQRAFWNVASGVRGDGARFVRLFISALSGTGSVVARLNASKMGG